MADSAQQSYLKRDLTLFAVVATAVCTVIGGGINVLTVEIHDAVPGIDGLVPLAFVLGALPAAFTAFAYAILASAMPRAGGGYIYISRGLNPYVGFIATFSKWWGYSVACGVVAYLDVALLRAAAVYAHMHALAAWLETDVARLFLPLAMVWIFWLVNLLGVRAYGRTVVVLMLLMLSGGLVLIVAGALANHQVFAHAMLERREIDIHEVIARYKPPADVGAFKYLLQAAITLFFAYIGFDAAAQAGGEARNASRVLPRAFLVALALIAGYYLLLSWSLYHAAPWQYVAQTVAEQEAEVSLPEILGVLLPPGMAVFVALMAALALANDIPAMLMAASRLFFAWANDGVFPKAWAAVHPSFKTPYIALTAAAAFATFGVVGCHLFGPVAMGVDAVVLALLLAYACVSVSVLTLPYRNRELHGQVRFIRNRAAQIIVGAVAAGCTVFMLAMQVKDALSKLAGAVAEEMAKGATLGAALKGHLLACPVVPWLTMLVVGTIIFAASARAARRAGMDLAAVFRTLPREAEDVGG